MEQAARVILTPEGSLTTPERWDKETPYLVDLIEQSGIKLNEHSWVLDYGCGIGRMSRAMIERFNCRVIGVDISNNMRAMAVNYVDSDRFFPCTAAMLLSLIEKWKLNLDLAICVWVLQHCPSPETDIANIKSATRNLFVVEQNERSLPMNDWSFVNDGIDVQAILSREFVFLKGGGLDPKIVSYDLASRSYWASYR